MAEPRQHPQAANIDELEARSIGAGTKFGAAMKHLGFATGAKGIGCTWYEVAPGKAAFPRHFHCVNEESLFVLEGEGTLRIGNDNLTIRAGHYVTMPVGPEYAHQLRNTGSRVLRYLCFSTLTTADVVGYPDSKKIGAMAAPSMEAALKGQHWVRVLTFEPSQVGYYDGEETD
jgi:uncharacterized cupin superfamily protein